MDRITAADVIAARENPPPLSDEARAALDAALAERLRPMADRLLMLIAAHTSPKAAGESERWLPL